MRIEQDSSNERETEVYLPPNGQDEISIPHIIAALSEHRRAIFRSALVAAVISTAAALLIPVKYTAEAVIVTPQHTQPSMSSLVQLSGNSAAAGLSSLSLLSGFGFRNASDLYVGILQSRTVADRLIERFHLKQVYDDDTLHDARKHLARNTAIRAGKDTLIHVRVDDRDPQRAADLANAYIEALSAEDTTTALNEAVSRRAFFEKQLGIEKEALADAEIALKQAQETTGLVSPTGQAEALIRSTAQLQAEILTKQAMLEGLRTYLTDENPRFQAVKREIGTLQSELTKLQQGNHVAGTPEVPLGQLPQAALTYLRRFRDLKYHETLYEALAKQYEAARLDEAKAESSIQVVDRAVPPEKRSWPPRTWIIIGCTLTAVIISSLWFLMLRGSLDTQR